MGLIVELPHAVGINWSIAALAIESIGVDRKTNSEW